MLFVFACAPLPPASRPVSNREAPERVAFEPPAPEARDEGPRLPHLGDALASTDEAVLELPSLLPRDKEPALTDMPDGPDVPELAEARAAFAAGDEARARDLAAAAAESTPLHVALAARALEGRIARASQKADVDAPFAALLALATPRKEKLAGLSPEERAVALDAIAEAKMHFAEQKRAAAPVDKPPRYTGNGEKSDVDAFIRGKVSAWIDETRARVAAAEAAYLDVFEQGAPRWAVASAFRVGAMQTEFVRSFRKAPYPKDWDREGFVPGIDPPLLWVEIRTSFELELAVASTPQLRRARQAMETCRAWAVAHHVSGAFAERCEAWLDDKPR
jgi:hypothetical protein